MNSGSTPWSVFLSFILFIGNVMAASMQRFYAYAIGQNDPSEIQKWFNCAFVIHGLFALLLVLVGIPFGIVLITFLNIPPDRLATCYWVYGLSIVGAVWTMLAVPYIGMFHARQRIFELSFWNSIQALLIFVLAGSLFRLRGDLLSIMRWGWSGSNSCWMRFRCCAHGASSRNAVYIALLAGAQQLLQRSFLLGLAALERPGAILSNQGLGILINIFTGGPGPMPVTGLPGR